jgi:hypothetical protein
MEILKTRRVWNDVFQVLKENNFPLKLLHPVSALKGK